MSDLPVSGVGRDESGFSLIELAIVVAIIGILINLAVPIYSESRRRAEVAAIVGDYRVVQTAVTDYYLANRAWPADSDPGEAPPELADYLGDRIDWSWPYIYDYDYFADSEGNATQPEAGVLVGFSIRDADPEIIALIRAAKPGVLTETWGNGVTFVIQATDAASAADSAQEPEAVQ